MSTFFADTSAIAKRYVDEIGSKWVNRLARPSQANTLVISELTVIEIYSVLARKGREGKMTPRRLTRVRATLLRHTVTEYIIVPLDSSLVVPARNLVTKYTLRTLDAIQLASSLHATQLIPEPIILINADKNLLAAAAAEGFQIDDPTAHP